MSLFAVLFILVMAASILVASAAFAKAKNAEKTIKTLSAKNSLLDEKLTLSKKELTTLKSAVSKKTKDLDETRQIAKRKLKKEALKAGMSTHEQVNDVPTAEDNMRLQSALEAVKSQLKSLQSQNDKMLHQVKLDTRDEFQKEITNYKEEIGRLNAKITKRKQETESQKGHVTGKLPAIDVNALSDEAAVAIAKTIRRLDNYEKMYGVSQGKLQMAQERFSEMQKRYFAVCRELALVAGSEAGEDDAKARHVAEEIILTAEHSRNTTPKPQAEVKTETTTEETTKAERTPEEAAPVVETKKETSSNSSEVVH